MTLAGGLVDRRVGRCFNLERTMDFDEWNAIPYTKVLHDSIANDYVPRTDLLSAVAAEREACAKVAEGSEQTRDWFPTSLWANLRNEIAARIRMRSNK